MGSILLKEGDKAPKFNLKIDSDQIISLEDLKGKKVILYFYPKDDTPGCTIEAKNFNEHIQDFKNLNCYIFGISKDDIKSHKKFKEKYCLNLDLAFDETGEIYEKYEVWQEKSMYGKKYMGIARTSFLIDEEGIIRKIWENVDVKVHVNEVLETVKAIS